MANNTQNIDLSIFLRFFSKKRVSLLLKVKLSKPKRGSSHLDNSKRELEPLVYGIKSH